jgi:hypothetical protein
VDFFFFVSASGNGEKTLGKKFFQGFLLLFFFKKPLGKKFSQGVFLL